MSLKRVIKLLVSSILVIVFCFILAIVIVDYNFHRLKPKIFYSDCFKVWAHRGFFKEGLQQNSIESFIKAFNLGAKGTELDIFYDLKTNIYIVSHDYPYNKINGRILKLEEVFRKVGHRGHFWLDFKNLAYLSKKDAKKAVSRLYDMLGEYNLREKIIVESINPINLAIVSKSNLYTSYWITPRTDVSESLFWFDVYRYKVMCLYGDFSAISMNYNRFNVKIDEIFSNIPIHLFTLNDNKILMKLLNKKNINIILTDEKNYYLENSCPKL